MLRAVKREKLKVKEKQRLELILGVAGKDTEMKDSDQVEATGSVEASDEMQQQESVPSHEGPVPDETDVDMKPKVLGKRTLKRHREKQTLKRLGIKKKKGKKMLKW